MYESFKATLELETTWDVPFLFDIFVQFFWLCWGEVRSCKILSIVEESGEHAGRNVNYISYLKTNLKKIKETFEKKLLEKIKNKF